MSKLLTGENTGQVSSGRQEWPDSVPWKLKRLHIALLQIQDRDQRRCSNWLTKTDNPSTISLEVKLKLKLKLRRKRKSIP